MVPLFKPSFMQVRAKNTTKNSNQTKPAGFSSKRTNSNPTTQFADNRPETVALQKLQAAADTSVHVGQLAQFQSAAAGKGSSAPVQRQVIVTNVSTDNAQSVAKELKTAGLPQSAFGVSTKAANYKRPQTIEADIHPGKSIADTKGGATTAVTTAEVGGLGKLESLAFDYGPSGDYDFAGGHLVGNNFWTSAPSSLAEENLVPMRQKINSSLYKIMEGEAGNYVGGQTKKINMEVNCSYKSAQNVVLSKAGKLLSHLENQGVDVNDDNKFDKNQSISADPQVPYEIKVALTTYKGNPDLEQKDFDHPGSTDIYRAKTYDKPNYVDGVGWDATKSKQLPNVSKSVWQSFDPVRLEKAGKRTYNFYQQATP